MLDQLKEISILYDFYGELLPEKQREFFRLYHEDNYSLTEIAEEFGITKQGVHEAVRRSEERLRVFEDKLGLAGKFKETEQALASINGNLDRLIDEYSYMPELAAQLQKIKEVIVGLNQ